MTPRRGVILFCRVPGEEPAKTRLADSLGPEATAAIYEACLLDALEASVHSQADRVVLCFSPENAGESLLRWLHARYRAGNDRPLFQAAEEGAAYPSVSLWAQQPGDLGHRMAAAFRAAFAAGWDQAVLVGSDIPGLHPTLINRAFSTTHDLVFGPALDGGFYLVGGWATPSSLFETLFDGVCWNAADTLLQTLQRAGKCDVELFEAWPDLDVAADIPVILRLLRAHHAAGHRLAPRLMPLLEATASRLHRPDSPRCTSVF